MSSEKTALQFLPLSSFVQPSFWSKLADLKINVDKLCDKERNIFGFFSNLPSTWTSHVLEVDSTSFNSTFDNQNNHVPFHGKIFNKNTIEEFKDCDKTKLINEEGRLFSEEVRSGKILETPSKLNRFFILSFSDLKKYHFYYWFAFPVPHNVQVLIESIIPITEAFSTEEISNLNKEYLDLDPNHKAYFLVRNKKICKLNCMKEIDLENYTNYYFAFADFLSDGKHPRSQFKNFIICILHHCPFLCGKTVNFLLLYLNRKLSCSESLIYQLTLPEQITVDELWAGWEKNEKGKFGPRLSNMKTTMDPEVLYQESVDLNLKLMKWRLLPEIDLEKIKTAKCLLLGAGTLGCSVARNLLGWGVRNMTFVDNSTVSYSNPVRQHLFTYEDALSNKPKAEAAAESLKKIFPAINTAAFQFTIPMPGHTVSESTLATARKSFDQLKELIEKNDLIFLLMDSRESRWLPTLLGVYYKKIIVNVALGFDTYLVMRYGRTVENQESTDLHRIPGSELGCYFCNDVTAPGNSMKDRTLDQQCTVTRPGVSSIAGALASELAVAVLQHPEGIDAPAFCKMKPNLDFDEEEMGILGIIPHSIRGFLSTFSHVLPATPKYKQCIACSDIVVNKYKSDGFNFLLEAFNSSTYLEELTGLSTLLNDSNYADVLELSGDEWEN